MRSRRQIKPLCFQGIVGNNEILLLERFLMVKTKWQGEQVTWWDVGT